MHCTIDYITGTITVSKNGKDTVFNTTSLTDIDFSLFHDRP